FREEEAQAFVMADARLQVAMYAIKRTLYAYAKQLHSHSRRSMFFRNYRLRNLGLDFMYKGNNFAPEFRSFDLGVFPFVYMYARRRCGEKETTILPEDIAPGMERAQRAGAFRNRLKNESGLSLLNKCAGMQLAMTMGRDLLPLALGEI